MARFIARETVIDEARTLPAPDDIFGLVFFNQVNITSGVHKECEAIELEELGRQIDADAAADWQRRAASMLNGGMEPGDAWLRKDGSFDAAKQAFLHKHPGFGAVSYDRAINYGIYTMR